ncbi:MAG TPA: nucleotide sugar dehydrogenase [Phycisphaerales bacterium]|nr:nucleotide sugar dehydrogenase [Phycisphaerales bacterium]
MSAAYSPKKIGVVGLGYVGLPVAAAFASKRPTVGFDINEVRVNQLREGLDVTGEVSQEELLGSHLEVSADSSVLEEADFIIVGVPTPIDMNRQPNLEPLTSATRTVGKHLKPGDIVVFESTVYPGVTEEVCAPILSEVSGLSRDQFRLGYSPERINPGDRTHTLATVVKIVSGEDEETLEKVASVYSEVVEAGVFRASSIRVAEAAKVIENVQRDINIALMNELSIIFERLDIKTKDVLAAAGSKWNFSKYSPGLVGGHCIGVDPYYLTAKAEMVGYHPEMILAGRRLNDNMSVFVAQKAVKMLIERNLTVKNSRIGILGVTFKENVTDCRNSKVFWLIRELNSFGVQVLAHDPFADKEAVRKSQGVELCSLDELKDLDGIIYAVPHAPYAEKSFQDIGWRYRGAGIFVDIRSVFEGQLPEDVAYWSL